MQYLQKPDQAKEFSEKALQQIQKLELLPTPHIFELWYAYYGETNIDIVKAVDALLKSGAEITNDICREIHKQHLTNLRETARVQKAGNQINQTIQVVDGIVKNVKSATQDYNESLLVVTEKLDGDIEIEEARAALMGVVDTTKNMLAQNAKLEGALNQSNLVMKELQRDLEQARKEALTDSLTGLSNRKALDVEIVRICEEASKNNGKFCFVMFDIDHFKAFNDNYGHQIGDQVLRLVGKTLFDGVKGRDMVARFGGEEFAMILPDTPLEIAVKLSKMLCKDVASKEVVNRNTNTKMGRITLSGGIAEFIHGETAEDIISRADAALYRAKQSGRNLVEIAT